MESQDPSDDGDDKEDSVEVLRFDVARDEHGQRLDRVLARHVSAFSRSYLQQLIAQGTARVGGNTVSRPAHRVHAGDALEIALLPTPESRAFRPEPMALAIVHQDADLMVINKPAGLVVHPAPGHWGGTLLNGLLAHDGCAETLPRAGIVHRLDKDTSGLMVVARSQRAFDVLRAALAARAVRREYLALAHGVWRGANPSEITLAVGRDPYRRVRMAVLDPAQHAAKPARTTVWLLHNGVDACLLRCALHSGRTHQIRVHLSHLGHPLVADALYGGAVALGMARQALHAWRLAFTHPGTGELMEFTAPVPTDLRSALDAGGFTMALPAAAR